MKNTTNQQYKKHLIDFEEFIKRSSEVSNYEVPYAAVIPAEDDKIWYYVKKEIDQGAKWGVDLKDQEDKNRKRGKRDGETGNKESY